MSSVKILSMIWLEEIPAEIKNGLEILFVETMDDVIAHAFVGGKGNN